jgi:hypothetical protein
LAVAQQNRHAVIIAVGNREVLLTIAIEIAYRHEAKGKVSPKCYRGAEIARAITQQDRHAIWRAL